MECNHLRYVRIDSELLTVTAGKGEILQKILQSASVVVFYREHPRKYSSHTFVILDNQAHLCSIEIIQ